MELLERHQVTTTGVCVGTCGATMIPRAQWYRLSLEARDELAAGGYARSQARGLCSGCYEYARSTDTLEDYRRLSRTADELMEDYDFIRDTLPRDAPRAERLRRAAERLTVTPEALDAALRRAGVAA